MDVVITINLDNCVNIALNKPATQSSLSQWSQPDESRRAVNGQKTGSWAFHTDRETGPWWQVDLEARWAIEAIVVWNREDQCAERASDMIISISDDALDWQSIFRGTTYFGGAISQRPLVHQLRGLVRARYVRISLSSTEYLHLDEVEIFSSREFVLAERLWRKWKLPGEPSISSHVSTFEYAVHGGAFDSFDEEVKALEVIRFERFGNNVHQLVNASMIASVMGIRDIVLFDDPFIEVSRHDERTGGPIYFNKLEAEITRRLTGRYFYLADFADILKDTTADDWRKMLVVFVRPLYASLLSSAYEAPTDCIYFHFRAGDIFSNDNVHTQYTQPPLSFYVASLRHAIEVYGVNSAVLVFEDYANPCINAFMSHLERIGFPYSIQSASLREDLQALLGARILCFSCGTFCESILALSENIMSIYAFRAIDFQLGGGKLPGKALEDIARLQGINMHLVEDPTNAYIPPWNWKNSSDQIEMMIGYPIENLRIVRR